MGMPFVTSPMLASPFHSEIDSHSGLVIGVPCFDGGHWTLLWGPLEPTVEYGMEYSAQKRPGWVAALPVVNGARESVSQQNGPRRSRLCIALVERAHSGFTQLTHVQ